MLTDLWKFNWHIVILLPQRVILECHIKLLWQTIDSLEIPHSLLCTPLHKYTAIHSKLHQTWKANLIHSFPLLAIFNCLCCFLSLVISWHALFLHLACLLFCNIVFLPVIPEVTLSSSALVVCVIFSIVEVLRLFLLLFPSSSLPLHWPCLPTHQQFQFEKEIHKIAWSSILSSQILPEITSSSITFGKRCYNPIFLRCFFFYLCYFQKSETCSRLMLPWCCLRFGLASSQGHVCIAFFLEFKDAPLTFFSLMAISNE